MIATTSEPAARLRGVAMGGKILGDLAVPIGEGGAQRPLPARWCRPRRCIRAPRAGVAEPMGAPPPARSPAAAASSVRRRTGRRGTGAAGHNRLVVLGDPPQSRQAGPGSPGRWPATRSPDDPHRLPGRNQSPHGARPGQRPDLVKRMIDDAGVLDSHVPQGVGISASSDSHAHRNCPGHAVVGLASVNHGGGPLVGRDGVGLTGPVLPRRRSSPWRLAG